MSMVINVEKVCMAMQNVHPAIGQGSARRAVAEVGIEIKFQKL